MYVHGLCGREATLEKKEEEEEGPADDVGSIPCCGSPFSSRVVVNLWTPSCHFASHN